MRTRFAPSPTGRLHLGHALAAKEAFGFAASENTQCLLRIEDIDHTRCKKDFTLGIYQDLNWLGFDWPLPTRVQSQHYVDYANVVASLLERGLAYPCTLTRSELKEGQRSSPENTSENTLKPSEFLAHFKTDEDAPHPKPSLPFAIRLNLTLALESLGGEPLIFTEIGKSVIDAKQALKKLIPSGRPDPIIARKDIGVSYHIAVTHDDYLQGITHVVRGQDLYDETPLHVLIQKLMDWPTPLYHHHALLTRDDGEKLSKRGLDTSLESLRENGLTATQVLAMASP